MINIVLNIFIYDDDNDDGGGDDVTHHVFDEVETLCS